MLTMLPNSLRCCWRHVFVSRAFFLRRRGLLVYAMHLNGLWLWYHRDAATKIMMPLTSLRARLMGAGGAHVKLRTSPHKRGQRNSSTPRRCGTFCPQVAASLSCAWRRVGKLRRRRGCGMQRALVNSHSGHAAVILKQCHKQPRVPCCEISLEHPAGVPGGVPVQLLSVAHFVVAL